jgi:hypothetical protein
MCLAGASRISDPLTRHSISEDMVFCVQERERLNEQIGEIQKKALDEALALDKEQKASTKPRKRK